METGRYLWNDGLCCVSFPAEMGFGHGSGGSVIVYQGPGAHMILNFSICENLYIFTVFC